MRAMLVEERLSPPGIAAGVPDDYEPLRSRLVVTPVAYMMMQAAVPFSLGRWIARRYPGREIAVEVHLCALHPVIVLAMTDVCWAIRRAGGDVYAVISLADVPVISWDGELLHAPRFASLYMTALPPLLLGAAHMRFRSRYAE